MELIDFLDQQLIQIWRLKIAYPIFLLETYAMSA
jgi:hypothetical protein